MQFREVTYRQQLAIQRLVHGPEADITERSLPTMPGTSMREILKHSQHPQNLEQIMLTLRRPVNSVTRRAFAEVGGELILIQKVTSSEPVVSDFKIAHFGQVMDMPEGMLYPAQGTITLFETWLRIEMLDALRMMIEENLVRSLLPDMQLKLITDMLQICEDAKHPELVRLYSFAVAVAALKRFHAARSAAITTGGFAAKATAFLAGVLDGPHAPDSIYSRDPFEQIKAITAAIEGLYLVALTTKQGDYNLAVGAGSAASSSSNGDSAAAADPAAAIAAAVAAGATLDSLKRSVEGLPVLQGAGAGPLLSRAVEKLWQLLQDRDSFVYTPPASLTAKPTDSDGAADANSDAGDKKEAEGEEEEKKEETEEQKRMRAAAEEAIAMSQVTFDENWHMFLKAVYDTELVPIYACVGMQLAGALLQLLAAAAAADDSQKVPLPSKDVLQQLSGYSKNPVLAATASILAGGSGSSAAAVVSLPGHGDVELSALAKSCCCCNKAEGADVKMLRCGSCGCNYYCSSTCQKADWKLGHKGVCKELGAWRVQHSQ